VRTALGGTDGGRFSTITVPHGDGTTSTTTTRTILKGALENLFKVLLFEIPDFRIANGGSVANRDAGGTQNHPNGVAIDINASQNWSTLESNPIRSQIGINTQEPHLISAEVVNVLNRHGWQAGYRWKTAIDGLFHWSISGT